MKLRLGPLTFDANSRQLLRGRSEVHLSPKAFDLLKMLIDARPRALAKAELQERLWPDLFVSDSNLASLVAEIRRVLADDASQPRFIRTVHRFGYAFCGDAVDGPSPVRAGPATLCWLLKDRRRVPLEAGENVLGRERDHGIPIDSNTVSRRHARITVSEGGAVLEDLRSKNGTFLRDVRITVATPLADGDRIRIGAVVLHFRTASASKTVTWSGQKDGR
jgi:DNA-binding winged helix-turn-helix (wHTH) protein